MLKLSVIRMIFSALRYSWSDTYRKISAKSTVVLFCHNCLSSAHQRFTNHKNLCNPFADEFIVHLFWLTQLAQDAGLLDQLLTCFIDADNRNDWIIWTLICILNALHFRYNFCIGPQNTPLLHKPWSDFVIFITSQMVLSVIWSTNPKRISSLAMACIVRCVAPSGVWE